VPIRSSNWSDSSCLDSTAFTSSSLIILEWVFDSKAELIYDKSLSGQQFVDKPEALRKFYAKSSLNEVVEAFWLFGAFLIPSEPGSAAVSELSFLSCMLVVEESQVVDRPAVSYSRCVYKTS